MTRSEQAKLSYHLRRMIKGMADNGMRFTTAEIYEATKEQLPDLIEEAKERLIREAVISMARQIMKEAQREDEAIRQNSLLAVDDMQNVDIPRCIAIPNVSDRREMLWVPTMQASPNELMTHIKYLRKSAKADFEKAKRLQTFHDYLMRTVNPDDMDVPIGILLCQARAA